MNKFDFEFDMIFADPPYFLSNGGISINAGKRVCVNKGKWDKSNGAESDYNFNYKWIQASDHKLKSDGTMWISGTYHNVFAIATILKQLGYKILNCITWAKTNPPPNISCRCFTHSTEFILWAKKNAKSRYYFNYQFMRQSNGGKQMRDLWFLPSIGQWEKTCGKHPTQKPLSLLSRIILASTPEGAWILDPFAGSSTTGIAACLFNRRFLGIDNSMDYLNIGRARYQEIQNISTALDYKKRIFKQIFVNQSDVIETNVLRDARLFYDDIPFNEWNLGTSNASGQCNCKRP